MASRVSPPCLSGCRGRVPPARWRPGLKHHRRYSASARALLRELAAVLGSTCKPRTTWKRPRDSLLSASSGTCIRGKRHRTTRSRCPMKSAVRGALAVTAGMALAFALVVAVEMFSAVVHPFPPGFDPNAPGSIPAHVQALPGLGARGRGDHVGRDGRRGDVGGVENRWPTGRRPRDAAARVGARLQLEPAAVCAVVQGRDARDVLRRLPDRHQVRRLAPSPSAVRTRRGPILRGGGALVSRPAALC